MKLKRIINLSFISIGSIIGAGFISGREVASFFLEKNIFTSLLITFICFFVFTYISLKCGKSCKNFDGASKYAFSSGGKLFSTFLNISLFITLSAMLAALDSFFEATFKINKAIPILSSISLIFLILVSLKGIKGIAAVNDLLVPVMIVVLVICLIFCGNYNVDLLTKHNKIGVLSAITYSGLNIFLSTPLLIEAGAKENDKTAVISSLIVAVTVTLLLLLIIGALKGVSAKTLNSDMPLLVITKINKPLNILFSFCIVFAIFTTLISSFYPLFTKLKSGGDFKVSLLCLGALITSRLGLKLIVKYLYPLIGLMGLTFFFTIALKYGIKKLINSNNSKKRRSVYEKTKSQAPN